MNPVNPGNTENHDHIVHRLTTVPEPIKHKQVYIPSKAPFYNCPFHHVYYPPPLPPVKKSSKYTNVKSKVNSNYKPTDHKTQSVKKETPLE